MTDTPHERPNPTSETEVMIVGAGPTGLALAISLRQAGIPHLIVDKLEQGLNTSRAAVIHVHTLETLGQLGVAAQLVAAGLLVKEFRIREKNRTLLRLGFERLPSPHPYLVMLPQEQTERILSERLAALGGSVQRGVTVTAIEQDQDGVTIALIGPTGRSAVRARFLIGGDGMHSTVRAASGTQFEGASYEESFVLADVCMNWPLGTGEVSMFFAPEGLVVVAPLPDRRFRIVASAGSAPEKPALTDIQALLNARGPAGSGNGVTEIVWSSRFRIHHRLARSYRTGRLFLMGDAAHVHSPAGGQGMNTGLVDAVVLGQLLTRAIRHGDDSALDHYQRLRRPAAEQVLQLAGRLTQVATTRGRLPRAARNAMLAFLNVFPPARKRLVMSLSGLSRKSLSELPGQAAVELNQPWPIQNMKGQST